MAMGAGFELQPSFSQPCVSNTPGPVMLRGGSGYSREKRGSPAAALAWPDTPIAHSTAEYQGSSSS